MASLNVERGVTSDHITPPRLRNNVLSTPKGATTSPSSFHAKHRVPGDEWRGVGDELLFANDGWSEVEEDRDGRKHLKIWQDNQSCRTIWFCSVRSDPATCKTRQLGQGFAQGSGLFVAVLDSILTGERVVTRRRQSITEPPD